MKRILALAAAALAAVLFMTRHSGNSPVGTSNGPGFSAGDIQDLRTLNQTSPGGFRAGDRAGRVEQNQDDQAGFIGL